MNPTGKSHIDPVKIMKAMTLKQTRFESKVAMVRKLLTGHDPLDATKGLARLTLMYTTDPRSKWFADRLMDAPSILHREAIRDRFIYIFAAAIPHVRLMDFRDEMDRKWSVE